LLQITRGVALNPIKSTVLGITFFVIVPLWKLESKFHLQKIHIHKMDLPHTLFSPGASMDFPLFDFKKCPLSGL
jgi:hypothetical protein